jgi:DNA mismatch endonuclease (patch repair protein)
MPDVLSPRQRSYCMSRIRSKNTKPELVIRRALFSLGFRYRLHVRRLPGCPDLVFAKYRAVIFIHGCLWHRHNCHLFQWPRTNPAFWRRKITKNCANDEKNLMQLRAAGWRVMTVWECAIRGRQRKDPVQVSRKIARWLSSGQKQAEIRSRP